MIQLRFTRIRAFALAITLGLSGIGIDAARAADEEPVLTGTWFVIVHYTDESTNNPDAKRWLDRVWTFKKKGSRLQWTDYPIVVLQDTSGRFERSRGNPRSRVLDYWEPDEDQLREIMGGPRVNSRGSKTKSLRGSDRKGWKSMSRQMVASATVMGYREDWSIMGEPGSRVFLIHEVLGNATMESAEGKTLYGELEVSENGREIHGSYERDGIKFGSFRMFRTKKIRSLLSEDEDESVNTRAMKRQADEWMRRTRPPD